MGPIEIIGLTSFEWHFPGNDRSFCGVKDGQVRYTSGRPRATAFRGLKKIYKSLGRIDALRDFRRPNLREPGTMNCGEIVSRARANPGKFFTPISKDYELKGRPRRMAVPRRTSLFTARLFLKTIEGRMRAGRAHKKKKRRRKKSGRVAV